MNGISRRGFLERCAGAAAGACLLPELTRAAANSALKSRSDMRTLPRNVEDGGSLPSFSLP